jgi:hypothetical protein
MFNFDLLADLPAPRDDEPPSLRSDIADELLDHLACAYRREILKDGDEVAAERRVLDRFGDPKKLARRLWWQAMWSRIMGRRMLTGLQWGVTLAAALLAGGVFWQQATLIQELRTAQRDDERRQAQITHILHELRMRVPMARTSSETPAAPSMRTPSEDQPAMGGSTVGATGGDAGIREPMAGGVGTVAANPPTLIVRLVQETEDGPPVTPQPKEIDVIGTDGKTIAGLGEWPPVGRAGHASMEFPMRHSASGRFVFHSLEPDRYELRIKLADGQHSTQPVLIRDDTSREMTVICPGPRKKVPVLVTMSPLPDDLREAFNFVTCTLEEQPLKLGQTEWKVPSEGFQELGFDQTTGQPTWLSIFNSQGLQTKSLDLRNVVEGEREVFLFSGPVGLRFRLYARSNLRGTIVSSYAWVMWPPDGSGFDSGEPQPPLIRVVKPGENRWELELPEELIAAARKQLAAQRGDATPGASPSGDQPEAIPD